LLFSVGVVDSSQAETIFHSTQSHPLSFLMAKKTAPAQPRRDTPFRGGRGKILLSAGGIAAAMFAVYYSVITYPFIQDDWYVLHAILTKGSIGFLAEIVRPWSGFFYRPIGELYFLLLYQLFHLQPAGYHFTAILIHSADVVLIVILIHEITRDVLTAWLTGIFYGAAVIIHRDPLFWIVGAFDLLGLMFFLLSYYLFLKKRPVASAFAALAGFFTKEATVVLPIILVVHDILITGERTHMPLFRIRKSLAGLRYHFVALGLYGVAGLRNIVLSPDASAGGIYECRLWGIHIIKNLYDYLRWTNEQLVFPLNEFGPPAWILAIPAVILAALFIIKRKTLFTPARILLACWSVIALLPVLPLVNHSFRYYVIYSLPAFYGLIFSILVGATEKYRQFVKPLAVLMMIAVCVFGMRYIVRLDPRVYAVPHIEGSNNLTWKGALVDILQEHLRTHYGTIPQNSVFVFDWVPTVSLGREIAPNIWYDGANIKVFEIDEVGTDTLGRFVTDPLMKIKPDAPLPPALRKQYLDLDKTILFKFNAGELTSGSFRPR
jgi:hypothetical protein